MTGSVSSSSRQGIWMMSFIRREGDSTVRVHGERVAHPRMRPGSGIAARARELDFDTVAKIAFAVLCVCFLVGFLVYPTYPNYDSYYSLLVGPRGARLPGPVLPGVPRADRAPAGDRVGALFSLLGQVGDRVWVGMTLATYLWLVWGIYRLGASLSRR